MKLRYGAKQLLEWRHEHQTDRSALSEIYDSLGPIRQTALGTLAYQRSKKDAPTLPHKSHRHNPRSRGLLLFSVSDLPEGTRIIRAMPGEKVPHNAIPIVVDLNSFRAIGGMQANISRLNSKTAEGLYRLFGPQSSFEPETFPNNLPQMMDSQWHTDAWNHHSYTNKGQDDGLKNILYGGFMRSQKYVPNYSGEYVDLQPTRFGGGGSPYYQSAILPMTSEAGNLDCNLEFEHHKQQIEHEGAFVGAAHRAYATTQGNDVSATGRFDYEFKYFPFFERYMKSYGDQRLQPGHIRQSDSSSSYSSCDVLIQLPAVPDFNKQ